MCEDGCLMDVDWSDGISKSAVIGVIALPCTTSTSKLQASELALRPLIGPPRLPPEAACKR